jgi:GNAT superfamily N-acetyltransferase
MSSAVQIRPLDVIGATEIRELSDVLIDCVEGGASVSFMFPMTRTKAEDYWSTAAAAVARGDRIVLAAQDEAGCIVGTVQLLLDLPENQPHRADVAKMLVHRRARRRGLGSELLAAAERSALVSDRTLLVLDTITGSDAERLYAREGWQRCGVIPGYALLPGGGLRATTVFYKVLRNGGARP